MNKIDLLSLPKEDLVALIVMHSRNALTIDGLWFIGVEERYGLEKAVEIDIAVWEQYGVAEATRIKKTLRTEEDGIPALIKALNFQIWLRAKGMEFEILQSAQNKVMFNITSCSVQQTRIKKGLGEFPCKHVGIALLNGFAKIIDPKFGLRCVVCPPDEHPDDLWCGWEFTLE